MMVKRGEVVSDVMEISHGVVEPSRDLFWPEAASEQVLSLLIYFAHHQYEKVFIKLDQIVNTAYPLQDIQNGHCKEPDKCMRAKGYNYALWTLHHDCFFIKYLSPGTSSKKIVFDEHGGRMVVKSGFLMVLLDVLNGQNTVQVVKGEGEVF